MWTCAQMAGIDLRKIYKRVPKTHNRARAINTHPRVLKGQRGGAVVKERKQRQGEGGDERHHDDERDVHAGRETLIGVGRALQGGHTGGKDSFGVRIQ